MEKQKQTQYQDPAEFIAGLEDDMEIIRPARYFYREMDDGTFALYFNPDITADPDGVKANKLLEFKEKFTAFTVVSALNRALLRSNFEFEKSVARQKSFLKKRENS